MSKRRGEKALNIAKRRKRQRKTRKTQRKRRKETDPSEKVGLRRKRQRKYCNKMQKKNETPFLGENTSKKESKFQILTLFAGKSIG